MPRRRLDSVSTDSVLAERWDGTYGGPAAELGYRQSSARTGSARVSTSRQRSLAASCGWAANSAGLRHRVRVGGEPFVGDQVRLVQHLLARHRPLALVLPLRRPETVAAKDVQQMVAAVHHACETLEGLAHAEHDQIRAAAQAGRILVPTRSLPEEYDIPYLFARAPQERGGLLARYAHAGQASRRAAEAVGAVAEIVQAPSRLLTRTRSAGAGTPIAFLMYRVLGQGILRNRTAALGRLLGPGPVETTLLDLGVTAPGLLAQSAEIDRHAERLIIDAAVTVEARKRPQLPTGLSRSAGRRPWSTTLSSRGIPGRSLLRCERNGNHSRTLTGGAHEADSRWLKHADQAMAGEFKGNGRA